MRSHLQILWPGEVLETKQWNQLGLGILEDVDCAVDRLKTISAQALSEVYEELWISA